MAPEQFAPSVRRLLATGTSDGERAKLLAGAVNRQLERAYQRFGNGQREGAMSAMMGGFFLMRAGEFDLAAVAGQPAALRSAAHEAARLGHEGYATVLYTLLTRVSTSPVERKEAAAHLEALASFTSKTAARGPLQALASSADIALQRALIEASPAALDQARDRVLTWLRRAVDANTNEAPLPSNFDRDEAYEAYRALRGGGFALVALYLRHSDPQGVLNALSQADLLRAVPGELRDRLERAANQDPESWAALYHMFRSASRHSTGDRIVDPDLLSAAAWGAAVGLYRSGPPAFGSTVPLALELVDHGMAEVATLLLAEVSDASLSSDALGRALSLALQGILVEEELGQIAAARRTFANAEPLLRRAEESSRLGKVAPSAARMRYVMAVVETHHGELARARVHLEVAAKLEPTPETLTMLANIERQRHDYSSALRELERVLALTRKSGPIVAETEALTLKFELLRESGNLEAAQKVLELSLARALDAQRTSRNTPEQARSERALARILEHYGDDRALRRATQRAYEASASDLRQLTATILDAARRALTRGDLPAARTAVQRALDAGLPSEDIIYVALWLQLLEKRLRVAGDGSAEEAYGTIDESSGWPAKLKAWARGKLSDTALLAQARGRTQRTEAIFYATMARAAAEGPDSLDGLKQIAQSEAIDLVEVTIARDLLAARGKPTLSLKFPPNLDVP